MPSLAEFWGDLQSWFTYKFLYPIKRRRLASFFSSLGMDQFKLVFDIGAHLGDKTRFFASQDIDVVGFEPNPRYVAKLSNSFQNYPNVTIKQLALGGESGEQTLHLSSRHPTVSTLNTDFMSAVQGEAGWRSVTWDQTREIEVSTLDHQIQIHGLPQFIKIDVEGYEPEVLAGLTTPINLISFEFLPTYRKSGIDSVQLLRRLADYEFAFSQGESYQLYTAWMTAEETLDWITSATAQGDIYARRRDQNKT